MQDKDASDPIAPPAVGLRKRVLQKPAAEPVEDEEAPPPYLGVRKQEPSHCSGLMDCATIFFATLLGVIVAIFILDFLLGTMRLLKPGCPVVYGRQCNERGTCENGVCACDSLFSGPACTDNQIPGYDIETNMDCNEHGFAFPFIVVPAECQQELTSVGDPIVGTGWSSEECVTYVQRVRSNIVANSFNTFQSIGGASIPTCLCNPGYIGIDCLIDDICPRDENGLTCGGNGNTSVGLIANFTNAGEGCQCENVFGLYESQYLSYYTAEQLVILRQRYNYEFFRTYCGQFEVGQIVVDDVPVNQFYLYTTKDEYVCYCTEDWKGETCTEGRCPANLQTKSICSGNGHPAKGMGMLENVTISTANGRTCELQCITDYDLCNNKCYPNPDGNQYSLVEYSGFCNAKNQCPRNRPVRCPDGTCAQFPSEDYNQCYLGYVFGTIDPARLDIAISTFKCDNITTLASFETCFRNLTEVPDIAGFLNEGGGGVFFNMSDSTASITVDLGSPLVYFQMVSNNSGIQITNFNDDIIGQESSGFFSGFFQYAENNTWAEPTTWTSTITKTGNNLFIVDPMPWNYSATTAFNESFATFRLANENLQLSVIVDALESQVELTLVTEFDFVTNYTGILVQLPDPTNTQLQPLWYYPDSTTATNEECLSVPAACSWYITADLSYIRTLNFQYYICYGSGNTTLVAQTTPCAVSAVILRSMFPDAFYTWRTTLDVTVPNLRDYTGIAFLSYALLNTNPAAYPFTITWTVQPDNGTYILLQDLVFLTLDRGITFPCACDTTALQTNRSSINLNWWDQNNTRKITDYNTVPGDTVLATVYPRGVREFIRGTVVEIDTDSNALTVLDSSSTFNTSVAYVDARKISRFEKIYGLDDCERIRTPFRCPDGQCSSVSSQIVDLDVACNCTFLFVGESDTPYTYNCSCTDTDIVPNNWGCICNAAQCSCGYPADSQFQRDLTAVLGSISVDTCSCIYYEGSTNPNDTYTEATNIGSDEVTFLFDLDTIPLAFTAIVEDCGIGEEFFVFGNSTLFFNITLLVNTEQAYYDVSTCEYVFNLNLDPGYVLSNITILVTETLLVNVTLINTVYGVSVTQMSSARNYPPLFTASSNSADAPNVNDWGYNTWESSASLRENPVWIMVEYGSQYYVSTIVMLYSRAGIAVGEFDIPARVYFQGANNDTNWYTLSSWDVYVNDTPVFIQSNITTNETFSKYRLISYGQGFGLRYWQLYSQSACNCTDEDIHLVINLADSEGLLSVETQYADMLYQIANLDANQPCICTDDCVIYNENVADNGVCNDVIFQASQLSVDAEVLPINETLAYIGDFPVVLASNTSFAYNDLLFMTDVGGIGYDAVQFSTLNGSDFLDESAVVAYFTDSLNGRFALYNVTTGLSVFYMLTGTLVFTSSPPGGAWLWVNQTYYAYDLTLETFWSDLLTSGVACAPGTDCTDCGPSNRIPVLMTGYTCNLKAIQRDISTALTDGDILFSRSFLLIDYENITGNFTGRYENIQLSRSVTRMQLDKCIGQTCPLSTPYKCPNGACTAQKSDCDLRYNCPGNGCVQLLDTSIYGAYRCACRPGFAGDACQYGSCRAATPFLGPESGRTPASEECFCGGPPPFRLKPPVLNIREFYDTGELDVLNRRRTVNSAPLSSLDQGYFRVMPIHAPWGQVITRKVVMPGSDAFPIADRTIYTTCPCARRGYRGEYYLMTDDIKSKHIFTGEPIWKTYTDPATGTTDNEFPWTGVCTYDDFPYRCPNGQCVANQVECALSEQLFPLCNNRGECRADGVCSCASPYRTFMISREYSAAIQYPYTYNKETGLSEPTVWELNYNWRYHGLNQCTARNCQLDTCKVPYGCFTGTPSLDFKDRYTLCQNRNNLCGINQAACYSGIGLVEPLVCSGNGIKRIKDVTGEEYCACGTPISPLIEISGVSQITQLKKNGYGGPACNLYYANLNAVLLWSSWNYLTDQPYKSKITGDVLPGVWIKGNIIVGPKPEDRLLWDKCCQGYSRLELCPFVPCLMQGTMECMDPAACIAYSPSAPLVFPCNGHGTARADGTCLCDIDEAAGEGYTHDFTQFSDNGCYKFVRCPISEISGESCNFVPQCSDPGEWRYPFPYDNYLEQQWFTCTGAQGPYTNLTKLEKLSVDPQLFTQQVMSSLAKIAERVIAAEADLQGCICFTPNDTNADRCCMVDNTRTYVYGQNFKSPYLLELTSSTPSLVDGVIEPPQAATTSVVLETGDTVDFYLVNNVSTRISAIRVFGTGPALVTFTTGDDLAVCLPVPLVEDTILGPLGLLNWVAGLPGGVFDCGPTYQCAQSRDFPLYEVNCGERQNTVECQAYLEQACYDSGNIYWPDDSSDIYTGCYRDQDINTCKCCELVPPAQSLVTDGHIKMTVTGNTTIGQVRLYGYTDEALDPPQGFKDILNDDYNGPADCRDDRYMRANLNADKTYYHPDSTRVSRTDAIQACTDTGGYLAIGRRPGGSAAYSVSEMSRECANIGVDNPQCWVNAVAAYDRTNVGRDELFNPDTCTKYGCYAYDVNTGSPVYNAADFYVRNESKYNTNFLTNEAGITGVKSVKDLAARLSLVREYFGLPLMYVASVKDTDSGLVDVASATDTFVTYYTVSGDVKNLYFTDDPNQVRTNALPTYLYGQAFVPPDKFDGNIVLIGAPNRDMKLIFLPPYYCKYNYPRDTTGGTFAGRYLLNYGIEKMMDHCAKTEFVNDRPRCMKEIGDAASVNNRPAADSKYALQNKPYIMLYQGMSIIPPPGGAKYCTYAASSLFVQLAGTKAVCVPTTDVPILTGAMSGNCVAFVRHDGPTPIRTVYSEVYISNKAEDTGREGIDRTLGYNTHPYLPLFALSKLFFSDRVGLSGKVNAQSIFQAADWSTGVLTNTSVAYYTKSISRWQAGVSYFPFPGVRPCSECPLPGPALWYWDQQYYTESVNGWISSFTGPSQEIYVQLPYFPGMAKRYPLEPLSSWESRDRGFFVFQTNYIQNYTVRPNPTTQWALTSCLTTSPNISYPLQPAICTSSLYNTICAFDWTKYAIQTGLQCDQCGPSTRAGNGPLPNVTCYDDNPLANATLFPFEHKVKEAYQRGTLDLLAESINIDPETIEFGNQSVIMGMGAPWELWSGGYSSRPGATSVNVDENVQSWCDLCLTCNWPVDCGAQVDPQTNLIERYCAVRSEYCNLRFNDTLGSFIEMVERDIPETIKAVDPALSSINPTCGPAVLLSSYFATDKYGGAQTDLLVYNQILKLTPTLIEIEVSSSTPLWYNGGKTNTDYHFTWNLTATISGTYILDLCPLCVNPVMEVFIYPLNLAYSFPDPILAVNVTPPLVVGVETLYSVNFTVTVTDTGSYTDQGELYPDIVFRGVGYRFYDVDIGASITLTNPVITDDVTREQCETRTSGTWYEPRFRIKSTAPLRRCIITDEDLELFPGTTLGQCACDLSTAGRTCDCPAVTSKYGKEVCGGYGDSAAMAIAPDGGTHMTGTTTEAGCYIWDEESTGTKYADCKTVDIGRSLFTLLVENAVFDYPSVYVETIPVRDSSLFRNLEEQNPDPLTFTATDTLCSSNGLYLPYYYTLDELSQLVAITRNVLPVFMDVNTTGSNQTVWPWASAQQNSYFLKNPTLDTLTEEGNCTADLSCPIVNFNNYAYGSVVDPAVAGAFLVDGNTLSGAPALGTYTISWTRPSDDVVRVYFFAATAGITVSCLAGGAGGECTALTVVSANSYMDCRCPFWILRATFASVSPTEVQIFSYSDDLRSDTYVYN